jgi:hypothetical protein
MKNKRITYHDLGFTDEEFSEIVDFYLELAKLGKKVVMRERLVQVLHGRLQQLIQERRQILLAELSRLEKF